jgi:hypothetical protein
MGQLTQKFFFSSYDVIATTCFGHTPSSSGVLWYIFLVNNTYPARSYLYCLHEIFIITFCICKVTCIVARRSSHNFLYTVSAKLVVMLAKNSFHDVLYIVVRKLFLLLTRNASPKILVRMTAEMSIKFNWEWTKCFLLISRARILMT